MVSGQLWQNTVTTRLEDGATGYRSIFHNGHLAFSCSKRVDSSS
jgi:hypothetical protein